MKNKIKKIYIFLVFSFFFFLVRFITFLFITGVSFNYWLNVRSKISMSVHTGFVAI
jgi:hypothetical protein